MHLRGACGAHHLDDLAAGGAAHDRVVHQDHPLAGDHGAVGGMLELDAEVADLVGRLNEGAADIVVAYDAELERDAARHRVAHRRGHARIRHRHDHVGLDRAFPRQLHPDALARLIYSVAVQHRVGPGEVDVLEHAEPGGLVAERADRAHAVVVDDDDLARLDVAHELGADDVERAGLARQHPGRLAIGLPVLVLIDPPQDQRPHAERVAHADQRLLAQHHQRVRAQHLLQCVGQPVGDAGVEADGDQVDEHLAVGGGLEDAASTHQGAAQAGGVGEVAVVADRQAAELELGIERLHVADQGSASGGVTVVADRGVARQGADDARVTEHVADQAQSLVGVEPAVRSVLGKGDDAGRLLAPVLQRMQTERRHRAGIVRVPDPEHAAFLVRVVVVVRAGGLDQEAVRREVGHQQAPAGGTRPAHVAPASAGGGSRSGRNRSGRRGTTAAAPFRT